MKKCPKCGSTNIIMMEYGLPYNQDTAYDGVSEFRCQDCKRREGRWSGKELEDDEMERRWGGEPVKIKQKIYE
jgi:transposase-like protein